MGVSMLNLRPTGQLKKKNLTGFPKLSEAEILGLCLTQVYLTMWGHSVSNHPMDYTRPSQILMKLGILVDLDPTAPILKF